MKILTQHLVVSGFVVLAFGAGALGSERIVTVSGSCTRPVTSDRGAITLTAEFTERDLQAATRKASDSYDRAREGIKRLNLSDLDLRTSEYQVAEHKEWEKDKLVSKGYRARMGIRVATSQVQRLGEVIALASREGLKEVGQLQTFLSDEKERKERIACLQDAAENARAKAEKLATSLGAKLGEAVSITEEGPSGPVQPLFERAELRTMAPKSAEMTPPQVEGGKRDITVAIRAGFRIQ